MAPKFKGDDEDWLDDEQSLNRQRGRAARPKKPKAPELAPEQANATVVEVFPNQCRVRFDQPGSDPAQILCSYRRAFVAGAGGENYRERTPVAVGDRVEATRSSPDAGIVEGICVRRNFLARPAPGRDSKNVIHVLAANVDLLVILAAAHQPEFSPGLVDRFLVAAHVAGIPTLLCVSKVDLCAPGEKLETAPWKVYSELGVEVMLESAKTGEGLESLRERLRSQCVVFCGHSGVGKTSLLRKLAETEIGKIGVVSDFTGKGRHTTTGAIMVPGPQGSRWIDTPGIKEFGLWGVSPEKLADYFPEMRDLECRRERSCLHEKEIDCQARALPRYQSYSRIMASLREDAESEEVAR
jgi:ribosome biogenesis GTPase